MFAQKLVTLSVLVLIFAVLNTNCQSAKKNDTKDDRCEEITYGSLCLNCTKAQTAIETAKTCLNNIGAGEAVKAAAASKPGEECYKKLWAMSETLDKKVDDAKLDECCAALKASAEKDLNLCFETQKPPKYP